MSADLSADTFRADIEARVLSDIGKPIQEASEQDWYIATTLAVRDRVTKTWLRVRSENRRLQRKRVYYLSIEFLIGRLLQNALENLGMTSHASEALKTLGVELKDVLN